MNTKFLFNRILFSTILILLLSVGLGYAQQPDDPEEASAPQGLAGTAFTYQGQLKKGGAPVTAACDFQFTLYNAASSGSPVGSMLPKPGVSVTNGLFSVVLDFGSGAFNGEGRWLGIQVKCPPDAGFTDLGHQELTPAPLALALPGLWTQQNATSPNVIGGYSGNMASSGVVGAAIGGGGASSFLNNVSDNYGTIGGGMNNQVGNADAYTDNAQHATVGGGFHNRTTAGATAIGGGTDNQASKYAATVGGGAVNQASGQYATIPGGEYNTAAGDYSFAAGRRAKANHQGAFVWGDSTDADIASTAADQFQVRATGGVTMTVANGALRLEPSINMTGHPVYGANLIGGFRFNSVTKGVVAATLFGGVDTDEGSVPNRVTDFAGTVSGGTANQAGNDNASVQDASDATVSGGIFNTASGSGATVGGGSNNVASGDYSTVPGGTLNAAQGDHSFAAGNRAKALHDGAFVWADSNDFDFSSLSANVFRVRATAGFRLVAGIDGSGGITWSCGFTNGNSWSCSSDRNMKENLQAVDSQAMLEQVSRLPVLYWNAKGTNPQVKHLGPMAQDFYAAFGLGDDEKSISTIDLDGVALAAIQGLYAENQELKAQVTTQQKAIDDIQQRLSALEQGSGAARSPQSSQSNTWLLLAGLGLAGVVVWQRARVRGGQP